MKPKTAAGYLSYSRMSGLERAARVSVISAQPEHAVRPASFPVPNEKTDARNRHPATQRLEVTGTPTGKPALSKRPIPLPGTASSQGLQNGLLLVLALYASMALLNLGSTLSAFSREWQQFLEFIVGGLF
jgi:hypothetical protein